MTARFTAVREALVVTEESADRRWRCVFWVTLAAITALGVAVRAIAVDDSLYLDEFYSWFEIQGRESPTEVISSVRNSLELSPPLYHLLALPFTKVSASPSALRAPSVLLGVAIIPLCAMIAKRAGGSRAGLMASALVALSPFLTFFSTEARPYTTAAFFSTAFVLQLLRTIEDSRPRSWALLTVMGTGAIYTHYTTIFIVAFGLIWLFLSQPSLRRGITLSSVTIALLFLPWLDQLADSGNTVVYGTIRGRGLLWFLTSEARSLVGTPYIPLRYLPGMLAAVAFMMAIATVGGLLAASLRRLAVLGSDPKLGLLSCSLGSLAGLTVYSTVMNTNLLTPRNLISATPITLCLIAIATTSLKPRRAIIGFGSIMVLVLALGAVQGSRASFRRPPQEAATKVIERAIPATGVVMVGNRNGWCKPGPGERVDLSNLARYAVPSLAIGEGGKQGQTCLHGVSYRPSQGMHVGSRGAVYLNRRYLIASLTRSSRDTWTSSLRERRSVAIMISQIDKTGKYSSKMLYPPREVLGQFSRNCFATFQGIVPIVVTVWQPKSVPARSVPKECREGKAHSAKSADYWRDIAILSFGNGQAVLRQTSRLVVTDLIAPVLLLLSLVATLFYSWARRGARLPDSSRSNQIV